MNEIESNVNPEAYIFVQSYLEGKLHVYTDRLSKGVSPGSMISRLNRDYDPETKKGKIHSIAGWGLYRKHAQGELVLENYEPEFGPQTIEECHLGRFCDEKGLEFNRMGEHYIITKKDVKAEEANKA